MSEPKTKPTDASVVDFLDSAATQRRREEGHRIAAIFTEVTAVEPVMWGPSIVGYGSFLYVSPANPRTRGTWFTTGFSPRKAQLTFYGLKDLPESAPRLARLGPHTVGAGCVYVKKLKDIDEGVLRELIALAFSRGIEDPDAAVTFRADADGDLERSEGPYGPSTLSGTWIIACSPEDAEGWAARCAAAHRCDVELRPFREPIPD